MQDLHVKQLCELSAVTYPEKPSFQYYNLRSEKNKTTL